MAYDPIASEYYTPRRVTSRNFDAATREALTALAWPQQDLPFLECGAGRGRTREYLGVTSVGYQLDSSIEMLLIGDREPSSSRICADSFRIPFRSSSFGLVTAWLFDAFNSAAFFKEVHRVLCDGGDFLGSVPSAQWGQTLRQQLGMPSDRTRFERKDGEVVEVPSYLIEESELEKMTCTAGFTEYSCATGSLPQNTPLQVSPHIKIVADTLGVGVCELPIVTALWVSKK